MSQTNKIIMSEWTCVESSEESVLCVRFPLNVTSVAHGPYTKYISSILGLVVL